MLFALVALVALSPPASPPPTPAAPPPTTPTTTRATRIAVYDLTMTDLPTQWGALIGNAITLELRKLQRTSVVSTDEIKTMLEHEANRQLVSCDEGQSCLAEVADALGVDVLVTGTVAKVGDEELFSLKRIDPSGQQAAQQVTRRFAAGSGEELLGAIGPAVAELFPEVPLRPGAARGVDKEIARRLNPPPLKPWVVVTGATTTGVLAVAAAGLGVANLVLAADADDYKNNQTPYVQKRYDEKANAVDDAAVASWVAGGAAVVAGAATGVAALFTDFDE